MERHEIEALPEDWTPSEIFGPHVGDSNIIHLDFEPLPDINTFELARCIKILLAGSPKKSDVLRYYDGYGLGIMRHFKLGNPVSTSVLSPKPRTL